MERQTHATTSRTFERWEVPVAYSLIDLIKGTPRVQDRVFRDYALYWMAFNNIYTTISYDRGLRPEFAGGAGKPEFKTLGELEMPDVKAVPERCQIEAAFGAFPDDLKDRLISHESTAFFVDRHPRLHHGELPRDAKGQHLNGVLNVGQTINEKCPVWSPINRALYERYMKGERTVEIRSKLAKQILDVLYTVRNNLFHGGKRADDAGDVEVVRKALPLLRMVVEAFTASSDTADTCRDYEES